MKLNLITNNKDEELVKEYLENNASETLAKKINNGTSFTKDGKSLTNKKTLSGFFDYANKQAREIAEKGKNYAHVSSAVVFGWAMHYFEEDSIEEKLYTFDGAEYTPSTPKSQTFTKPSTPQVKQEPKPQLSMFDMLSKKEPVKEEPTISDEPSDDDIQDAFEELQNPTVDDELFNDKPQPKVTVKQEPKRPVSPVYQKYLQLQDKYPDCIVIYRLGDFYEVLGQDAVGIAAELDLTLTGRDCGLDERIPMIGFPYHIADKYIGKLVELGHKVAVAESLDNVTIRKLEQEEKHWINDTTFIDQDGIVHEEIQEDCSMDSAIISIIQNILGEIVSL